MKLPELKENSTPDELLAALGNYIDSAEKFLDEKNMIDLAGLDIVVDALCKRVLKLSKEQHKTYADKLDALGTRLSGLQEKMITTQAAMKVELSEAAKRQQASRAYRKDPG